MGDSVKDPRTGVICACIVMVVVIIVVGLVLTFSATSTPKDAQKGELHITGSLYGSGMSYDEYEGTATLIYQSGGDVISWEIESLDGPVFEKGARNIYELRSDVEEIEGRTLRITEPGRYAISLFVDGKLSRNGMAILGGNVVKRYSWDQDDAGKDFSYSFEFSYPYSALQFCTESDIPRDGADGSLLSGFATTDVAVTNLEYALRTEYRNVRGQYAPTDGQDYADYLLSFIQCCFSEPDPIAKDMLGRYVINRNNGSGDTYLYGTEEYRAFPVETIHMGMGDDEDIGILTAALFSAAGYGTGLIVAEEQTFVYVALADYAPTNQGKGFTLVSKKLDSDGSNIFICDPTTDRSLPTGYLDNNLVPLISNNVHIEPIANRVRSYHLYRYRTLSGQTLAELS